MSSSALDWRPICQGWLKTLSSQQSDILWSLFDSVFQVSSITGWVSTSDLTITFLGHVEFRFHKTGGEDGHFRMHVYSTSDGSAARWVHCWLLCNVVNANKAAITYCAAQLWRTF